MDLRQFLTALVSSLLGLLPLMVTALLNWLDKRGGRSRKEGEIDFAQRRVAFLSTWLEAREKAESGDSAAAIKESVAQELDGIKEGLDPILLQPHIQPIVPTKERNFFQRLLLLYPPHKLEGWVYRGLFFMSITWILFFITIVVFPDPTAPASAASDTATGAVCLIVPAFLFAIVVNIMAGRSDRKAEQAMLPEGVKAK